MSQQAHETVVVPREPDPKLMGALASIVRRVAIPASIDPDEVYFDSGAARLLYRAVVDWHPAPVSPDSDLLKEAVGVLKDVQRCTQGPSLDARISAFLSKVEERGHD